MTWIGSQCGVEWAGWLASRRRSSKHLAAEPIASLPMECAVRARYLGSGRHGTSTSSIWYWPCPVAVAVADHLQSFCLLWYPFAGGSADHMVYPYRRMNNGRAG